jgi:thioester reductase-like protein
VSTDTSFLVLVQKKFEAQAETRIMELESKIPGARARIQVAIGDITEPDLGIRNHPQLSAITEIDHFAAVYDLSVAELVGTKINVEGTKNVLDLIPSLPSFRSLHYVSTCYVSGAYAGRFLESDLEKGQRFNNFYESTKHEAELLVRKKMEAGLPAAIYRPSIVVGDSRSGVTQKFDGPYFVMQWLLRQGKHAILPSLGDPNQYTINLVPSNYVLDAMAYLSQKPSSLGKTFQLADPQPLSIAEVVEVLARNCDRKLITVPLPKGLAKLAVSSIPGLERWMGIPSSALDYFVHPTNYDVTQTLTHLEGSGIHCPVFSSYSQVLVDYMKQHPGVRSQAMI